jgi:glycosyltransferase involved in cell wall biosynthesis
MGDARPLVSIGLPVYNGGAHLRRALDSLLAQEWAEIEIVVRDNASTDDTEGIVREYAARDMRLRWFRNGENLGAARNFQLVLEDAAGKYFMWAAHDDRWSSDYVGRLVNALQREPRAVLAAGKAVFSDAAEGGPTEFPDSPPPDERLAPFTTLLRGHATHWIYGVFVRERLLELAARLWGQPLWGGDMVWLMGLSTSEQIAGDEGAVLYKTLKPSSYAPATPREIAAWQLWYGRSILGEVLASPLPLRRKISAAGEVGRYWWKYVTSSGYAHLVLTWLRAARDLVGAGTGDGP